MKVLVPHSKPVPEIIDVVDRSAQHLFESATGSSGELKKNWEGPKMDFQLTVVLVEETIVIVDCELPPVLTMFVGEDKIKAGVEKRVRGMLEKK